jgi:hypothetical protein
VSGQLNSMQLKDGYYRSFYNLKIEEDCKKRMDVQKLEVFYRLTMAESSSCLSKLSVVSKNGLKHLQCFNQLFKNRDNPPKLLCGGWPFGEDVYAVGSFPGSSRRHPYLWLSPKITTMIQSNPEELKATLFHETLHNCGHTHSEGIEVTYTCEECCFNQGLDPKKKESACRICAGVYQNENDPAYVRDLLFWSISYPNWGRDMRLRVLDAALASGELENVYQVLLETKLSSQNKDELKEILLKKDKQKWAVFKNQHQDKFSGTQIMEAISILVK